MGAACPSRKRIAIGPTRTLRRSLSPSKPAQINGAAALVPEMPEAGEDHGDAGLVGGGDYFGVAAGPAGLDRGGGAGGDRCFETVGERVEGVRRDDRASGRGL